MKRRLAILTLAAVSLTALTATGAFAAQKPPSLKVHLKSVPAIKAYLRSHGVSTAGLVIQRSKHNYAGRHCPGSGWACTRATNVVQLARAGGSNQFECSASNAPAPLGFPPAGFPATNGSTSCVIVQKSVNGNNKANCLESSSVTPVTLTCAIHQENTNGRNDALVGQLAAHLSGSSQDGSVKAWVEQQNSAGQNNVVSGQAVLQFENQKNGTVSQAQTSNIFVNVSQTAAAGKQSALAGQAADLNQTAGNSVTGGSQNQDSTVEGHVTQNNVNVSTADVHQFEDLDQQAPNSVSQTQFGPMSCCANQSSNPNDKFNLKQNSELEANTPGANQSSFVTADCSSSGTCNVDQTASVNGASQHQTCTGPFCTVSVECFAEGSGEGSPYSNCFPGGSESLRPIAPRSAPRRAP